MTVSDTIGTNLNNTFTSVSTLLSKKHDRGSRCGGSVLNGTGRLKEHDMRLRLNGWQWIRHRFVGDLVHWI